MTDLTDPVDATHAAQSAMFAEIRHAYANLRVEIAIWEPRPCPDSWRQR